MRVLVDGRALACILSVSTYTTLGWGKAQLKKSSTPLVGFVGESITPIGCIELLITLRKGDTQVTKVINFVVIDNRSVITLQKRVI